MAYFLATNVLSDTPPSVIPYIFGNTNQYIKIPIVDYDATKVETDIYITKASLSGSAIMGSQWGGGNWLLAQDGNLSWMTSPRTTFASSPIVVGGHKLVMDLENGSTYDGVSVSSPGATVGCVNKNICLFASSDTGGNKADVGIGRTKFYNHGTMLADLVPVNVVNTDATVLLDNAEFLGYDYESYSADLRNITPIRDTLRLRTRYLDTDGVMHYADDYTIAISDLSAASWDVRPYTTFDDDQQVQWVIQSNKLYYQMNSLPTGAVKVFADVTVSGTQKEGGFYDIVNDKYYFSDTSTPLVYSEL